MDENAETPAQSGPQSPAPSQAPSQAWADQVAYHLARAAQEKSLADQTASPAGRTAHLVLHEHHLTLAATAQMVTAMDDPDSPRSPSLHQTGAIIRDSFDAPE